MRTRMMHGVWFCSLMVLPSPLQVSLKVEESLPGSVLFGVSSLPEHQEGRPSGAWRERATKRLTRGESSHCTKPQAKHQDLNPIL